MEERIDDGVPFGGFESGEAGPVVVSPQVLRMGGDHTLRNPRRPGSEHHVADGRAQKGRQALSHARFGVPLVQEVIPWALRLASRGHDGRHRLGADAFGAEHAQVVVVEEALVDEKGLRPRRAHDVGSLPTPVAGIQRHNGGAGHLRTEREDDPAPTVRRPESDRIPRFHAAPQQAGADLLCVSRQLRIGESPVHVDDRAALAPLRRCFGEEVARRPPPLVAPTALGDPTVRMLTQGRKL